MQFFAVSNALYLAGKSRKRAGGIFLWFFIVWFSLEIRAQEEVISDSAIEKRADPELSRSSPLQKKLQVLLKEKGTKDGNEINLTVPPPQSASKADKLAFKLKLLDLLETCTQERFTDPQVVDSSDFLDADQKRICKDHLRALNRSRNQGKP